MTNQKPDIDYDDEEYPYRKVVVDGEELFRYNIEETRWRDVAEAFVRGYMAGIGRSEA